MLRSLKPIGSAAWLPTRNAIVWAKCEAALLGSSAEKAMDHALTEC
jgi:hypothetical protein